MMFISQRRAWIALVNLTPRSAASWALKGALLGALAMTGCGPKPPLHGTAFVVAIEVGTTGDATNSLQSISRIREVLQKRLVKLGVQSVVEQQEDGRLLVKIAQVNSNEVTMVRQMIVRSGVLEFRLVDPDSDKDIKNGDIKPGYEVLRLKLRMPNGKERTEEVEVSKRPAMTGSRIKNAMVVRGNLGEPEIHFTLDSQGAKRFAEITRENVHHRLAIVLDGNLYSAPVIQTPIESGSGQITGHFDEREAFDLANLLENPLEVPYHIVEEKSF
jgi:protein-export membrane protein SecD